MTRFSFNNPSSVTPLSSFAFLGATTVSSSVNPATLNSPATIGFGTTNAKRWIIAAICGGTTDRGVNSVTIGGVTATIIIQENGQAGNGTARPTCIAAALVPTNADQSVVITATGADQWQVHFYSVIGDLNLTPVDSFKKPTNGAGALTFSLATKAGGFVVGIAGGVSTANSYWSGDVTKDVGTASPGGTSGHNTSALTGATLTNIVTVTNGSITTTCCVSMGSK